MNQAIKLNPSFSNAFLDRGIANYDKNDYDRTTAAADPLIASKPTYTVVLSGRGSAYENRREGDRIIQEASQAIRNNQYNAHTYSPDTFPPAGPEALGEPAPAVTPVREPVAAATPEPTAPAASKRAPASKAKAESVPTPHTKPPRRPEVRHISENRPAPRAASTGSLFGLLR